MRKIVLLVLVILAVEFAPAFVTSASAQARQVIDMPTGGRVIIENGMMTSFGVNWPIGWSDSMKLAYVANVMATKSDISGMNSSIKRNYVELNGPMMKKVWGAIDSLRRENVAMKNQLADHEDRLSEVELIAKKLGYTVDEVKLLISNTTSTLRYEMKRGDSVNAGYTYYVDSVNQVQQEQLEALDTATEYLYGHVKFPRKYQKHDACMNRSRSKHTSNDTTSAGCNGKRNKSYNSSAGGPGMEFFGKQRTPQPSRQYTLPCGACDARERLRKSFPTPTLASAN